ncbi:MAG: chorismate synthase [Candidatus Melainabacteria bacterium]
MRFLTAGESHGPGLTVLIDDFPAGVPIALATVNADLARRQQGYGRGPRQKIETDTATFQGGVRFERSTGAPIAIWVENRDARNWLPVMSATGEPTEEAEGKRFIRPRPGHADLAGFYKYGHTDLRDALERSSARETAARVAAGGVARCLLAALGIRIFSHVTVLGGIRVDRSELPADLNALADLVETNDLRCGASEATQARIRTVIDDALRDGTTLGGEIEVVALHVPPGLGSYTQWDRKLDGLLAQAVMSIQAVKAVSIGEGELGSQVSGHDFHDEIVSGAKGNQTVARLTNRAGGLEGGVTNGMPVIVKAVMKPISTMRTPLRSVNLDTLAEEAAHFERSDVTAVPACGVIAEAMVALVLAEAVLDKFGGDCFADIEAALKAYTARLHPVPVEF